jgi:hypothetical protein
LEFHANGSHVFPFDVAEELERNVKLPGLHPLYISAAGRENRHELFNLKSAFLSDFDSDKHANQFFELGHIDSPLAAGGA